jgi:hypothetical protein
MSHPSRLTTGASRCRRASIRELLAVVTAGFLVLPLAAHHSHGNYTDAFRDIEGTVREVHLVNPHSWIYLDVKSAGGPVQVWALEATNRVSLERMGIMPGTLKRGEAIKVRCHPLRDGSRACLLGFVKTSDGTVKDWDGTNLPLPADF